MIKLSIFRIAAAMALLVMVGCASQPAQTSNWPWPEDPRVDGQGSGSGEGVGGASGSANQASSSHQSPDNLVAASDVAQSLVADARRHRQSGDFSGAVQRLERAISITPRDPVVWFELARVRLAEEQWAEAENLAQRALEYTYGGDEVIPWCWELIARSREERGDFTGADQARRQAQVRS